MTSPGSRRLPPYLLPGVLLSLFVLGYPLLLDFAMARVGVRPVALILVGVGILTGVLAPSTQGVLGRGRVARLVFIALPVIAVIQGDRTALLFFPALIYASLCLIAARSLREPPSLIERLARQMHPYAPDFIGPYCRKVTAAWSVFFLANAGLIGVLAVAAPIEVWKSYTGFQVYLLMGFLTVVEFLIRKSWFRYFPGHYLDRLLATLFPPENTATGRRSSEYLSRMRRELGLTPPPGDLSGG